MASIAKTAPATASDYSAYRRWAIVVLLALGVLFIFAYALKKEYWKDVK